MRVTPRQIDQTPPGSITAVRVFPSRSPINWSNSTGAEAPATRSASMAALNLALLLIVLCLPPVVFDFEIQIGEVGK